MLFIRSNIRKDGRPSFFKKKFTPSPPRFYFFKKNMAIWTKSILTRNLTIVFQIVRKWIRAAFFSCFTCYSFIVYYFIIATFLIYIFYGGILISYISVINCKTVWCRIFKLIYPSITFMLPQTRNLKASIQAPTRYDKFKCAFNDESRR